jgi:uncharacterized protein (DUF2252 family)
VKHVAPRAADRGAVLISARNLKMARSAHAYVRGSTLKFYEWLEAQKRNTLPEGPAVWICGDCHAGNLGPVADAKGRVEIQIRDFDQTVIGNPAHDLIRLGLSLATAARGSDLPGVTTTRILEEMVDGYGEALSRKDDETEKIPKAVGVVMKRSVARTWKHLARERIEDTRPAIPLGKKFWPLGRAERTAIKRLLAEREMRKLTTLIRSRDDDATVELVDAAYWMKGCSSLGRFRAAVLLAVAQRGNSELCLMDIKEAVAAAAPRYAKATMPRDNAARVVEGARQLSPCLGERMRAARLLDRSVFIRELLPQDLKLEIDQLNMTQAARAARYLASVVGRAHARQMVAAERKRWQKDLARRSKTLNAPSWLWSSVVALVASHEAAYLEHCRSCAMQTGAP